MTIIRGHAINKTPAECDIQYDCYLARVWWTHRAALACSGDCEWANACHDVHDDILWLESCDQASVLCLQT